MADLRLIAMSKSCHRNPAGAIAAAGSATARWGPARETSNSRPSTKISSQLPHRDRIDNESDVQLTKIRVTS